MEGGNMKRQPIFFLSLALCLFLIGLPLAEGTTASGPTLRINIAPRTGPPGTAIGVTGEGAQTDKLVKVVFATSGEGGTSLAEFEVTAQADGTFTATITVPYGTGGGTYAVRAEQTNPSTGNLIHYWYNSFVVTGAAAATATPEAAAPTETAAPTEAAAPVVPTVTAEPTVSATGTITATETATPAATTAATLTPPGEMPTTGDQSSESNNTAVIAVAVLATLGILAALGAGLRQARKT
jgi:hypothetical protein